MQRRFCTDSYGFENDTSWRQRTRGPRSSAVVSIRAIIQKPNPTRKMNLDRFDSTETSGRDDRRRMNRMNEEEDDDDLAVPNMIRMTILCSFD